jgi:hypothetical protein
MFKKEKNRSILIISLLVIMIIGTTEIRASLNKNFQQDLDTTDFFPAAASMTNNIDSLSTIQQQSVLSYLEDNWNLSKMTDYSLPSAIEIICRSVIACSSVPSISEFEQQVYDAFNLILSANLSNSKETLNMSSDGIFYIWNGVNKNVSTSMNFWIAKALFEANRSLYVTSIETTESLISLLNQTVRGPDFFRSYILLDPEDEPDPLSISPIARLNDQLMVLTLIKNLILEISSDSTIQEYQNLIIQLERDILDPLIGFVEEIVLENLDYPLELFHSIKYQDLGGTFYFNNKSSFSFENSLLLLDFFFLQFQDYSSQDKRGTLDFYDLDTAQLNLERILNLLRDIQSIFQNEADLYHEEINIFNNSEIWTLGDKSYIGDQFRFIQSLSKIVEWFSFQSDLEGSSIYSDQFHEILLPLWEILSEKAFIQDSESTEGIASETQNASTSTGYFFSYYSSSLGLYLFDNTTQGSLLFANILALNGLGSIFPFQMTIEYLNPVNIGENQDIKIMISPIPTNKTILSTGIHFNSQLLLSVPIERLDNILISTHAISVLSNSTSDFRFTISAEGLSKFTLKLVYKQITFFILESEYLVLKQMSLRIDIDPTIPTQRDQITITIEVRDNKGIIRNGIYYSAKIQSKTWNEPFLVDNQSLFDENSTKNSISFSPDLIESDLTCYFIVLKDNYYPAEINQTIHVQTSLNFLFNWLRWIIFESEIGGYIGTTSALFAIMYGFYIRFISRTIGRTKTCKFCGESWRTKYPVCSHCGRDLKPEKIKKTTKPNDLIEDEV